MLHFHPSNRLETLAAGLAEIVRAAPLPPLAPEVVVVPSSHVGRWLGFELAARLGIAANVRTEFAAAFVWRLIRRVLPDVPETSPLEPERLRWPLAAHLGVPDNQLEGAARYLAGARPVQRFELAAAVADAFDRYLVYRPDWIAAWSRGARLGLGPDEAWQAALWQALAGELPAPMRDDPRERFFAALAADPSRAAELPRRIHLFAVTALPPLYLDFLRRLAERAAIDVHVHAFNPCREYWRDIVRRRDLARAEANASPAAALLEVGNALLASLGHHGRAVLDALAELDTGSIARYEAPSRATLLGHLQADILDLAETPHAAEEGDDTVALHVCHGAMREVEVLHDRLLDRFAREPDLTPDEVLVLVPDIDAYAPCIEAVFATAPAERRMPFSIADRGLADHAVARTLRLLLAWPGSRMDVEQLLAPLECAAVARRFGIAPGEQETAREWLREAGVRWGRDESSRVALGLPPAREHSWQAGLDRMLLGYAMAGDDRHLYAGVLPYDAAEGGAAQLAGRLHTYADAAFALAEDLERPRTVREWRQRLDRALDTFFDPDEDESHHLVGLRLALAQVAGRASGVDDAAVPLAIMVREWFAAAEAGVRSQAFLGHGITFAALRPGRAVPARVVVLLGMNDGAYPRLQRAPGFDLAARAPRPGDRIRRDEDRYAFLESLLAARERFWMFHTGRSVRDNEPIPPSPLVAEVIDAVRRAAGEAAAKRCVVEHPLQPFSAALFDGRDAGRFSYARAWVPPPRTAPVAPFLPAPLEPPPADQWTVLTLDDLGRLLRNPAERLLRRRLGIHLAAGEGMVPATEPFTLDPLELSEVTRATFARLCDGVAPETTRRLARASGALPDGTPGELLFDGVLATVAPLAARARAAAAEPVVRFDLAFGAQRLAGSVQGRETFAATKLGAPRRLASWVRHLALNAAAGACETATYGLDGTLRYAPVANARELLAELVALHGRALCEALPFFARSSFAYAKALETRDDHDAARAAAWSEWCGSDFGGAQGERKDAYIALAFRHTDDPLDGAFAALAEAVCLPMLNATIEAPE
jgi:exodeoxyribonuclease V gamma subunit